MPRNFRQQQRVPLGPINQRISALRLAIEIGSGRNRHYPADRLKALNSALIIDTGDHGLRRRWNFPLGNVLRAGKTSQWVEKDFISLAQLSVLPFRQFQFLGHIAQYVSPLEPVQQFMRQTANLGRNR